MLFREHLHLYPTVDFVVLRSSRGVSLRGVSRHAGRDVTPLASYSACQATTVYQGVARQGPAGAIGSTFPLVQEPPRGKLATAA